MVYVEIGALDETNSQMGSTRIAIIGAGYSGLSAGYELAKNGQPPVLLEADRAAGGLAGCVPFGDTYLEKFYHHWFNHDHDILELIDELGLQRHLVRGETNTSTFYDNQVYRLSSPLDVLRFKPLSLLDRTRLGWMVARGRTITDYRQLEGKTARQWITEMAGRTVYDVVWRPLFEGKFGHYADGVSAVWFWSKLRARGRSRTKRQREELVYLEGGLQRLTQAMIDAVTSRGGQVRLGCPVQRIRRANGAWEVVTQAGAESFDQVLVTTPTPIGVRLLEDLPDHYRERSAAIPYLGVTELMLVLNRRLSETYWLNVNDGRYPFVGVIEHTNFQPPDAYAGRHIVYVTKYRSESDEIADLGHRDLFERWRDPLQRMFPAFEESWVTLALSWQNAHAQPVVLAGREGQILPAQTPLPGVWTCAMAQIYPEDRGTNYAVRLGRRTARAMLETAIHPVQPPQLVRIPWPAQAARDGAAVTPVAAMQGLSPA